MQIQTFKSNNVRSLPEHMPKPTELLIPTYGDQQPLRFLRMSSKERLTAFELWGRACTVCGGPELNYSWYYSCCSTDLCAKDQLCCNFLQCSTCNFPAGRGCYYSHDDDGQTECFKRRACTAGHSDRPGKPPPAGCVHVCSEKCFVTLTTNTCEKSGQKNRLEELEKMIDIASEQFHLKLELPDRFWCDGQSETLPAIFLLDGPAGNRIGVKSVEELLSLGESAMCGVGDTTVLDQSVRSTKRVRSSTISVEWLGLEPALLHITNELCRHCVLSAELHEVLVYAPGDFVLPHRDAMKKPAHVITLVVDCGITTASTACTGGAVMFDRTGEKWESRPAGYCAWFTSEHHEVQPVTSGFRVVAVYNVIAESRDDPLPPPQKIPNHAAQEHLSLLAGLPEDTLGDIFTFLEPNDYICLSACCTKLLNSSNGVTGLAAAHFRSFSSVLSTMKRLANIRRVGFVLRHQYSADGASSVPVHYLRGSDRVVLEAAMAAFSRRLEVVHCEVAFELVETEESYRVKLPFPQRGGTVHTARLCAVGEAFEFTYDKDRSAWSLPVPFDEEIDVNPARFVPTDGVMWLDVGNTGTDWAARRTAHSSAGDLWGNQATFSCFVYKDAAVTLEL